MKRRYDVLHAIILIAFLVIAGFVGSAIIKGILLFVFATALTLNTAIKLKTEKNEKLADKLFYGTLLLLEGILVVGALFVIVTTITEK